MARVQKAQEGRKEIRQETTLKRPPRLEGVVKNKGTKPVRKPKKVHAQAPKKHKPQGVTAQVRKDYQLKSPRRTKGRRSA